MASQTTQTQESRMTVEVITTKRFHLPVGDLEVLLRIGNIIDIEGSKGVISNSHISTGFGPYFHVAKRISSDEIRLTEYSNSYHNIHYRVYEQTGDGLTLTPGEKNCFSSYETLNKMLREAGL
jgi:hypothetical protein